MDRDFDLDAILSEFGDRPEAAPAREEPAEEPAPARRPYDEPAAEEPYADDYDDGPAYDDARYDERDTYADEGYDETYPEEDYPSRRRGAAAPRESAAADFLARAREGAGAGLASLRERLAETREQMDEARQRRAAQAAEAGEESPRPGAGEMLDRAKGGIASIAARLPRRGEGEEGAPLPRWAQLAITVGLLVLSLLCMSWIVHNVHPGSGTVVSSKPSVDLSVRADHRGGAQSAPIAAGTETEEGQEPGAETPAPVKLRYVIDENAVVAPAPDPACFGKISIAHPEETLEVIQKARDYGLLREDETVIFDPEVTFYYDEDIEYYLDETILVICWKEVIDGNTCSFVEIKIADASQFRRKFADDTFAAASQYYSTEMHKSTNAVVTLNADFYQNRDFGVVVYGRTLYRFPTSTYTGSYSKYNCLETCFVNSEGDFLFTELGQTFTKESMEQYIRDNDILFSMSFGPVLVQDGQVRQVDWYPVGEIDKGYSRAGIGQVDKLHYLYMSLNHSAEKAARWTVNTFAQHFGEKAVINAYCLDGGQTGEIVFQGRAYNHVDIVNGQKERPVSDNIYFATAIGGTEVYE